MSIGPHQLARMYEAENFGVLTMDWRKRSLTMTVNGLDGDSGSFT